MAALAFVGACWSASPPPRTTFVPFKQPDPKRVGVSSADVSARARLAVVEAAFATWDALKIEAVATSQSELDAQVRQLRDAKTAIEEKLATLEPLGTEYAMAATLRFGDVQLGYLLKVVAIPQPTFLTSAQFSVALDADKELADEAKRSWVRVFELAKHAGISNQWSRLARENLAREFPSEYPPFHQEIVEGTDAP